MLQWALGPLGYDRPRLHRGFPLMGTSELLAPSPENERERHVLPSHLAEA